MPEPTDAEYQERMNEITRELEAEAQRDKDALAIAKSRLSEKAYAALLTTFEGHAYGLSIETQHNGGTPQEEGALGTVYIDQTCNGGISGDSYAGTISVYLAPNEWFQFHYSM